MSILKEFTARLNADQVLGTYDWLYTWDWRERNKLKIYLDKEFKKLTKTLARRQQTILFLVFDQLTSVMDIESVKLALVDLDEEEIQEVMAFYDLVHPKKRYKKIKSDINGPESFLTRIPYPVIYELYKRKKVPFDRQVFAGCLVRFNVWHGATYTKELPKEAEENLSTIFPTDDFTLDILMAVFEMELGANQAFYFQHDYNIGGLIISLINRTILDRNSIHNKLFEAFNNPSLKQTTHAWLKKIHSDLAFTTAELMPHQDKLINLLYNDRNLLAAYGLQVLKKISQEVAFNWELFSLNLEGIVYREKFNGGLKIALDLLKKQLKKAPHLGQEACLNLAPIFLQPDHKIQLKAKAIFELVKPTEALITALEPYIDTMQAEVKKDLSAFLLEAEPAVFTEVYQQEAYTPLPLLDSERLEYIGSEEDYIFLASKVLKSQEALDHELFLEGFLRFQHLSKTNLNALKPALKQAKRLLPNRYANISNKVGAHHLMLAKLICVWLDPDYTSLEEEAINWALELKNKKTNVYTATQWLIYFKMLSRIPYLSTQIGTETNILPLLSTPTHSNGQIHPALFLNRLAAYEAANVVVQEGDFNRALCCLHRSTSFENTLLKETKDSEHRAILQYLFNSKEAIDIQEIKNMENSWLVAYCLKNPNKAIDATLAYQQDEKWWQTAPSWDLEAGRRYGTDYSWATTTFNLELLEEGLKKECFFGFNLVYDYARIADIAHWFHRDLLQTETLYLNLCAKHFTYLNIEAENSKAVLASIFFAVEKLHPIGKAGHIFLVLSLFCQDRSVRASALEWLCQLIEHKMLNLALFIAPVKKLLVNEHHPIPMARVNEQVNALIALRGTYENVAFQMGTEIVAEIAVEHLPKGFAKLLSQYFEMLQSTKEAMPEKVYLKLEKMTTISAVKKVAKKILNNQDIQNEQKSSI
ncbi:MAG: Unknown protein [uncultured Aureispira sp.]|uniref:Uncharacterized protein n=1 Tax=uncultured Aureispira sp. TaxID=1331704 RepID=A0A6S6UBF8_9BACT|nr:MAG: Unknown protein [uncultured Aureispira sp.]